MELDEVIVVRSNFDYYSKNFLDYTDIDVSFVESGLTNQTTVNDLTWTGKIAPVTEGIFHSGEKAAKLALERLKKLK
jgi:sulfide-dependent adenosine diphosphate thiazole synthase